METEYLKEFVTIAQLKSFSLAAEQLCISQSSLSKHIKTLESDLNHALFDRTTRTVQLTEFGKTILDYAIELTKTVEHIKNYSIQHQADQNHLHITSIPVMAQYKITKTIADFLKLNPHIHLTFSENESVRIPNLLESRRYELAFTRYIDEHFKSFEYIPYMIDELVLLVSKKHSLSKRKRMDLSKLNSENFIFFDENTLLFNFLNNVCINAGFTAKIVQTSNRPENIVEFVAQDLGIAFMFRKQAEYLHNPNVVILDLEDVIHSEIGLSKIKGHKLSPAAQAFWNYINNEYSKKITSV